SPITCTSICFGSFIYVSSYIASLPKADFAYDRARSYASANSFLLLTIRIPRPPPPSEALMIIGYPYLSANFSTSEIDETGPSRSEERRVGKECRSQRSRDHVAQTISHDRV